MIIISFYFFQTSTKNSSLDDVAWYEDCVFYVVNSTKINWLNLTSRQGSTLEDINSVQSIAIDWLGRKIYWADPSKQSVIHIFISLIKCNNTY